MTGTPIESEHAAGPTTGGASSPWSPKPGLPSFEPSKPEQPSPPTPPGKPTEPGNPSPSQPTEPTEPTEPTQPTKPAEPPPECRPITPATLLSQTCLYSDISTQTLDFDVQAFEPAHTLWTDGATKRRWIRLPRGTKIDTGDMNHWEFPVGTQFFKEFSLNGVRLETRLFQRFGPNPGEWGFVSFVWRADQSDAVATTGGATDVNGTQHDVPSQGQCLQCHQGEPGRILGFSAVQLSKNGAGLTLDRLVEKGLLSSPPPPGASYAVPGNATEAGALGFLHGNCGHCHNPNGSAYSRVNMVLQTGTANRDVALHPVLQTAVGVSTTAASSQLSSRIAPGAPDASEILRRAGHRGAGQMPPLGTERVDEAGLARLRTWIEGL